MLPFLLFSGFAGYLSEGYSKRMVVVTCKVAEIGIVLLGMVVFAAWNMLGMSGLLAVLFLWARTVRFSARPSGGYFCQ